MYVLNVNPFNDKSLHKTIPSRDGLSAYITKDILL